MYSEAQLTQILNQLDPHEWYFQMGPYTNERENVSFVVSHEDFNMEGTYVNIGQFYCDNCNGLLPNTAYSFLKSIYRSFSNWEDTRQKMLAAGFKEKFLGYPTIEQTSGALLDHLLGWKSNYVQLSVSEYEDNFNNNYGLNQDKEIEFPTVNNMIKHKKSGTNIKSSLNDWVDERYEDASLFKNQWKKISKTVTEDGRIIRIYQNKVCLLIICVIEKDDKFYIDQYLEVTA